MVTRTTSDSYGVSSILKSCSNNTFTKKGSETDFQKLGYKTEYNPVLNEPDSADFPHWILGKYTQKARNIKSLLQTQSSKLETITISKNKHQIPTSQIDNFWKKLKNRQVFLIGDSLGRQVLDFMEQIVILRGKCNGYKNIDFWGYSRDKSCNSEDPFNPKIESCFDPVTG